MPMPHDGEEHDGFIDRCMGDGAMNSEFADAEQRRGICERQWEGASTESATAENRERCLGVICADPKGEALSVVQISPGGRVRSKSGEFLVDRPAFERIYKAFMEHGVDLPIDVEHESLRNDVLPIDTRGAVGWIRDLKFEEAEGISAKVEWTEEGRTLIRSGKFRYLSPAFTVDKNDRTRVTGLHSGALVLHPAIPGMRKLAAGQRTLTKEKQTMELQTELQKLVGGPTDTAEMLVNKVGELKKKAAAAEAAGTALGAVRKNLGLKEDAGENEIVVAINSHKMNATSADATKTELAALKDKIVSIEAQKLIDGAIAGHKINPRAAEDLAVCTQLAKEKPEVFAKLMAERKPLVEPGRTNPPEGGSRTTAGKEEELIANAVKEHKGNVREAITALQIDRMKPYLEAGLSRKAAIERCTKEWPGIFGEAA